MSGNLIAHGLPDIKIGGRNNGQIPATLPTHDIPCCRLLKATFSIWLGLCCRFEQQIHYVAGIAAMCILPQIIVNSDFEED